MLKTLGHKIPKIVLASQSPRRKELLAQLDVEFQIIHTDVDESVHPNENPTDYVLRVAKEKAEAGLKKFPSEKILGADTIVVLNGEIFLKPVDKTDHIRMLRKLSGQTHHVLTAVALASAEGIKNIMTDTAVTFRELSEFEINHYWDTGEPCDKSGGYASQGIASTFIKRIEGSWSGVVGLPLFETFELLRDLAFE